MNGDALIIDRALSVDGARNYGYSMSFAGQSMGHFIGIGADTAPACFRRVFLRDVANVQRLHEFGERVLMTRAGTPAANTAGGIERVTTEPAPTTLPCPIVTPRSTITRVPNHTSGSMCTGAALAFEPATPW